MEIQWRYRVNGWGRRLPGNSELKTCILPIPNTFKVIVLENRPSPKGKMWLGLDGRILVHGITIFLKDISKSSFTPAIVWGQEETIHEKYAVTKSQIFPNMWPWSSMPPELWEIFPLLRSQPKLFTTAAWVELITRILAHTQVELSHQEMTTKGRGYFTWAASHRSLKRYSISIIPL